MLIEVKYSLKLEELGVKIYELVGNDESNRFFLNEDECKEKDKLKHIDEFILRRSEQEQEQDNFFGYLV